jgi:tetratricopeptide (TPR) repeat protein
VEGRTLAEELARGRLPLRERLHILERVARAVAAAHAKGIVHRDLKPGNILLTADGQPKVGDFGLARLADSSVELTRTGTTLGTPLYMAPEQVEGKDVSARTDVYALGAILYQTLAGRPPHEGTSVAELYAKILGDEPVPPGADAELEGVALKALAKDPGDRYASAEAFADDLARHLRGEPVLARRRSWIRSLARRVRRRPRTALAALLLVATAGAWTARELWNGAARARRVRAAEGHERAGELEAARRAYAEALRVDPFHGAARGGLDRVEAELRRSREKALALLEAVRPKLEDARRALYDAAAPVDDLLRLLGEADPLLREALSRAPDLTLAHYRLGEAEELRGRYDQAEAAWSRAAEIDPRFGPARYQRARALLWTAYLASLDFSLERKERVRAEAERLTNEALREAREAGGLESGFDPEFQRALATAMAAYLRGDAEEVGRLCRDGVARFERRQGVEEFLWLRGLAARAAPEKLRAFDAAIARRPKFPLALFSRAKVWLEASTFDRALNDLDQAIRYAPSFAEAILDRGSARYAGQDFQGALADYEAVIALGKLKAGGHTGRGGCLLKLGRDAAEAEREFTLAIESVPEGYYLPYEGRAEARLRLRNWAGSIADCDRGLAIVEHGRLRVLRARAVAGSGRLDEALGTLEDLFRKSGWEPYAKELEALRAGR